MKDGASLEMRVSNNEGYARCVNTTIDVYICVRLSESASVSEVLLHTCWDPRFEDASFVRVKQENPYMNPSSVVGRGAPMSQSSPSIGSRGRIRNECVCEPS